jgi:hypothetical protein
VSVGETSLGFHDDDGCILSISFAFNILSVCSTE